MFLVNDGRNRIEEKLKEFFSKHPSAGLILAAIFFEWTVCRALICLSSNPNKEILARLEIFMALNRTFRNQLSHSADHY